MRPPRRGNVDYERIQTYDEWIPGIIEEIELEENRKTGFKNKDGTDKYADQVRFKFKLDGHEFAHRSRWMGYSFGEKSNIYLKFLKFLVEGAQPDMEFDLDELKGFKIKTMWSQNGDFDNLEQIRPAGIKLKPSGNPPSEPSEPEPAEVVVDPDTDIQF